MGASLAPIGLHLITMSINQKEIEHYQELVKEFYPDDKASPRDSYTKSVGKVTICGKDLEFIFCKVPISLKKKKKRDPNRIPDGQSLIISRKKTIRKMTNLINTNAWEWKKKNGKKFPPIFLTLTFGNEVTDLKIANRLFSESMQRYNYRLFKGKDKILQYVTVPEFMKNGRVHYHCLIFNLPFSFKNYDIARDVWGNGHVKMKAAYTRNAYWLSKYMSKYMLKACDDPRFFRKRKYFPSANLLRPIVIKDRTMTKKILEVIQRTRPQERVKKITVDVDFIGFVDCYYCHLEENEDITDLLPELDLETQSVLQSEINREREKLKI